MTKRGESLLKIIIIIIILTILSGALILTLSQSSPLDSTKKANFLNDIKLFEEQLELYKVNQDLSIKEGYIPYKLYSDENTLIYDSKALEGTLTTIIPALENNDKYVGEFEIVAGELWYKGQDAQRQSWSEYDAKIRVRSEKPKVSILTNQILPIKAGSYIEYTLVISADIAITSVDLDYKVKITNTLGGNIGVQPNISIIEVIGTKVDKFRIVKLGIDTTGMNNGKYKVKVLTGAATSSANISNEDKVSSNSFEINNSIKNIPSFKIISQDNSMKLRILACNIQNKIQYSIDGIKYQDYKNPIDISNSLVVYAKEIDLLTNEIAISTIKIDK